MSIDFHTAQANEMWNKDKIWGW